MVAFDVFVPEGMDIDLVYLLKHSELTFNDVKYLYSTTQTHENLNTFFTYLFQTSIIYNKFQTMSNVLLVMVEHENKQPDMEEIIIYACKYGTLLMVKFLIALIPFHPNFSGIFTLQIGDIRQEIRRRNKFEILDFFQSYDDDDVISWVYKSIGIFSSRDEKPYQLKHEFCSTSNIAPETPHLYLNEGV